MTDIKNDKSSVDENNKESCSNCVFSYSESDVEIMVCRRYPPTVSNEDRFPETDVWWWCGEWKPKTK